MLQNEIYIKSSIDGTMQPSLFYKAKGERRPLLVALHTWSYDRFNQINNVMPFSLKYDFNVLLPEFRGPNLKENVNCKFACGSEFAKQDIKDAIDYIIKNEDVDENNIFLLGLSGGGHMALLMAGMCPEYFKAIASFVPITNLHKWALENPLYKEHIYACCGEDKEELLKRSPVSYIENIAKSNTKIFHGKFDDAVPFTHSVDLYREIIENYPDAKVYLDIFDGGHEIDLNAFEYWFISQYKKSEKVQVTG